MKIISFIVQTDVIRKILVGFWEEFSRRRPLPLHLVVATAQGEDARRRNESMDDDGWPGYEEPWVDVHSL